jgi:thiol-disulfide isomerase/thioredoxin
MIKIAMFVFVFICTGNLIFAQNFYEISRDKNGSKVLKGIITKNDLSGDTAFSWFHENQKGYKPYADAVTSIHKNKDSIQLIAFSGTWCGDSKYIIPKLFSLLDSAAFPQERLTLIAVDRNKKTTSHLAEAFNIVSIPTLIVMKEGKEIGRVVEYGKNGMFDKELGEIIKSINLTLPLK